MMQDVGTHPMSQQGTPVIVQSPFKKPAAIIETTDVASGRLQFDQVYLNGVHVMRKFKVQNISNTPVKIKLRTNLGKQINFQLSNENLADDGAVVDAENVNQLFNYINYVDEVDIPRGQAQDIIVLFMPDARSPSRGTASTASASNPVDKQEERFDSQEINGLLFIHAYLSDDTSSVLASSTAATAAAGAVVSPSSQDSTMSTPASTPLVPSEADVVPATDPTAPIAAATPRRQLLDEFLDLSRCDQQVWRA